MEKSLRFLLSRDDWYHQRGYWVLANTFRNTGIEVILGGIQTPGDIAKTAIQEDVDLIGYRIMQGAPGILLSLLFKKLQAKKALDIPVIVGGIIPKKEEVYIKELGVKEVFHPYSALEKMAEQVKTIAIKAREKKFDHKNSVKTVTS